MRAVVRISDLLYVGTCPDYAKGKCVHTDDPKVAAAAIKNEEVAVLPEGSPFSLVEQVLRLAGASDKAVHWAEFHSR